MSVFHTMEHNDTAPSIKAQRFWDSKHAADGAKEWIAQTDTLLPHMLPHMPLDGAILEIGAGTSALSLLIAQALPAATVVATDVSPLAVQQMASTHSAPNLTFAVLDALDATSMAMQAAAVQAAQPETKPGWSVVVDKGCLDTFLFRYGTSVNPVPLLLSAIHQALRCDGVYIICTPRRRIKELAAHGGFCVTRIALPADGEVHGELQSNGCFVHLARKVAIRQVEAVPPSCSSCGQLYPVGTQPGSRQERKFVNHLLHCKH